MTQARTRRTKLTALEKRFLTFLAEPHPLLVYDARQLLGSTFQKAGDNPSAKERDQLAKQITKLLTKHVSRGIKDLHEPTPFVSAGTRMQRATTELEQTIHGFFEREAIRESFTRDEKLWMLEGILLTRAVDNRMKKFFLTGEVEFEGKGFQGKGFRSLGQEAIYAAGLRLKRRADLSSNGQWKGDVVAPLIRDLGIALAFCDNDPTLALSAQAGKAGPPLEGKDLHLGHSARGVLPAAAPLAISTATVTGCALAMKLRKEERVALAFIGEGGSSLGEWHEAINLGAVRKLPIIYSIQNNQTALSTPTESQSASRVFADKGLGYGMPQLTIDGTDPEAVASAYSWAADHARAGHGPTLIETVAMRMCGHAHHDDMLYLGVDPELSYALPPVYEKGYADKELYEAWAARDPIARYSKQLLDEGVITADELSTLKREILEQVDEAAEEVKARPWPKAEIAGAGVYADDDIPQHPAVPGTPQKLNTRASREVELASEPTLGQGRTSFLESVCDGIGDVLRTNPDAFVFGEDVAPPYGNAFMLLRPLMEDLGERIINAPLAENAIIGACVGAGIEGMCPIGEMQFNDFVASGFNQLVNNASMLHYRTGLKCPMVMRMPWGGLRRAGPYHSQDTSPWFYRTPGLKIVVPSTPHDARALMRSAARDAGPVLYYEHIALYRDPKIKQDLSGGVSDIPIGKAAFRSLGEDVSIITYGAFVHRATRCALALEDDGISCDVLDLRSLAPLDWEAISSTVLRTNKVLLIGEDSRSGSILESIASRIADELFEYLDGPVRVVGALDTPVPYSPSLEHYYLPSDTQIMGAVRELLRW